MRRLLTRPPQPRHGPPGQALVEYALILALALVMLVVALAVTGPAIANVFNNSVVTLVGAGGDWEIGMGPDDFWLTVTWAASQTPDQLIFPPNNPNPPDLVPPFDPTLVTFTPTSTATNTVTATPSGTPTDRSWNMTFVDPAQEPLWYRINADPFIGLDAWLARFYTQPSNGTQTLVTETDFSPISIPPGRTVLIDGGGANVFPGWGVTEHFSARFDRTIYLAEPSRVQFDVLDANDGVRVWLNYTPGCSPAPLNDRYDPGTTYDLSGCLVINEWRNQTNGRASAVRNLPAGEHTVTVTYYQQVNASRLALRVKAIGNSPDDTAGGDCRWNMQTGPRSNTRENSWESYRGSTDIAVNFPPNTTCNLELRGYINLNQPNPELTWWDVWSVPADTTMSLQLAPYGAARPANPGDWTTVWSRTGGTANFAWTRNVVDWATLQTAGLTAGGRLTYRFVIQSGGGTGRRIWFLDDVRVESGRAPELFSICDDRLTCNGYWSMDSAADTADFIASGRWGLSSTNARSGQSWDLDPTRNYEGDAEGRRIHSLQLNGALDFTGQYDATGTPLGGVTLTPDVDGDTGYPQLSFYMGYDVRDKVRLELQYRDGTTWRTLRRFADTTTGPTSATSLAMRLYEVRFTPDAADAPVEAPSSGSWTAFWTSAPVQVRWVKIIEAVPTQSIANSLFIDEIIVDRVSNIEGFTAYPFQDNAGDIGGVALADQPRTWVFEGRWASTTESAFAGSQRSYADSPGGNYIANSNSSMVLRRPFDLNSDSPGNPFSSACDASLVTCQTPRPAPVDPTLTFYWWRDLERNDNFTVEVLPASAVTGVTGGAVDGPWQTVWSWNFTNSIRSGFDLNTGSVSSGRRQLQWERAEVPLRPFIVNNPAVSNEDDLYIRFRLQTDGSNEANGVFIDNIRVGNLQVGAELPLFRLGQAGDSQLIFENVDDAGWFNRFSMGGTWGTSTQFTTSGARAFHDSPPGTSAQYRQTSWSPLEWNLVVDLSTTNATDSGGRAFNTTGFNINSMTDFVPGLYFWHRYHLGNNARIRVQVARADAAYTPTVLPYDRLYGYTAWADLLTITGPSRSYSYVRDELNLAPYINQRIRLRFILDTFDVTSDQQHGWFIDDISVSSEVPNTYSLPFEDRAFNMRNWIAEGSWGLDDYRYRGSTFSPLDESRQEVWRAQFWNCNQRPGNPNNCADNAFQPMINSGPPSVPNPGYYYETTLNTLYLEHRSEEIPPRLLATTGLTYNQATNSFIRWNRHWGARFNTNIQIVNSGNYRFTVIADDGVRVRLNGTTIIDEWRGQPPTRYTVVRSLNVGTYNLEVDYYQGTGGAHLAFWVDGPNERSRAFTDSPRTISGAGNYVYDSYESGAPAPAVQWTRSALQLDGLLDLTPASLNTVLLSYDTLYEFNRDGSNQATANVEVSTDGGFTWVQTNLTNPATVGGTPVTISNPSWTNANYYLNTSYDRPNDTRADWQRRVHNLTSYKGRYVALRFRLNVERAGQSNATADGWYITNIAVQNAN